MLSFAALLPDHPPLAAQVVTPEATQESTVDWPAAILGELVAIDMVGAGAIPTFTFKLAFLVPLLPVQLIEYTVVADGEIVRLPEIALAPLHPPDARQDVVFELDQLIVVDSPIPMDVELASKETVGN